VAAIGLTACGDDGGDATQAAIKDAESLSYAELVEKAKAEIGSNKLVVYGNSSQLEKALTKFKELTGIDYENNQKGDNVLYESLTQTIGGGIYSADMILAQDGSSLQTMLLDTGYAYSYLPKEYSDVLAADDKVPATASVYLNKLFMYNNTDGVTDYLHNVWQLAGTTAENAAKSDHIPGLSFKTAGAEAVNMNFLIMLTSPEWQGKLAAAYKSYYGTDYVPTSDYSSIAHKWIAEFLKGSSKHSSDGDAVKGVASGIAKSACIANMNKIKDVKATGGAGTQDPSNITFSAFDNGDVGVEGFSGFVYKMYSLISKTAKYPLTAAAFINFLTSEEGYASAWGGAVGYYSANPNAAIASGDRNLAFWKSHLVIEDPVYVTENYFKVSKFILSNS
jgi:iron(III) transport system substrate-binding protein